MTINDSARLRGDEPTNFMGEAVRRENLTGMTGQTGPTGYTGTTGTTGATGLTGATGVITTL